MRRIVPALAAAAAAIGWGTPVRAQQLFPTSSIAAPSGGGAIARLDLAEYDVHEFVDRFGNAQRFPGPLTFQLATLEVSYGITGRLFVGALLPYRRSTYEPDGVSEYEKDASPGAGAFAGLRLSRPGGPGGLFLRVGYFRARPGGDAALTTSDELDRWFLAAEETRSPDAAHRWEWAARLGAQYARRHEGEPAYFEGTLDARAGPRVAAGRRLQAFLEGAAGYRLASAAIEEDAFFHNRRSQRAYGGLIASVRDGGRPDPRWNLRLGTTWDIGAKNALSGTRYSLTLERRF